MEVEFILGMTTSFWIQLVMIENTGNVLNATELYTYQRLK